MAILRRITAKDVMECKPVDLKPKNPGEVLPLFRVWGKAFRFVIKDNPDMGTSIGLKGQFRAKRFSDGKEFDSAALWLPVFAVDPIASALSSADVSEVILAYDVSIRADRAGEKPTIFGFSYEIERVIEPDSNDDPLSLMATQFKLSLPAPEPEPEPKKKK